MTHRDAIEITLEALSGLSYVARDYDRPDRIWIEHEADLDAEGRWWRWSITVEEPEWVRQRGEEL